MLFGDHWQGTGAESPFTMVDPSTGKAVVEVPMAGPAEVDQAVEAAAGAAAGWRAVPPHRRRDMLWRLGELVLRDRERFGQIAAVEQGLPGGSQYARFCAEWVKYYAGWAEKIHGSISPSYPVDALAYVLKEPFGVVAVITPFNESLAALGMKAAPALASGNCIVIKPPEQTPVQTVLFAELCLEAGIPAGVVNVVTGGPAAGEALVSHPKVGKVTFTGGLPTARAILRSAAANLTPVVSELGGKSANIVFADGDWKAGAALSALNACVNLAGQGCMFPTRLLVEGSIHDQVVKEVVDLVTRARIGDPAERGIQMGPVISAESAERIHGIIGRARGESRLVTGGDRLGGDLADGYFIEPTVFDDVDPGSELAQNEVFGPVLAISTFESEHGAVDVANGTSAGLAAYVFTDDLRRAHRMARELQAGSIGINGMSTVPPTLPFGGYKGSGSGREGGIEGLLEFLQTKSVFVPLSPPASTGP
jgi:aldehyde dehydrogenase (NAD+)